MSDAIITVEQLGKCYRIAHQQQRQRYTALRDVISERVGGLFRNRKSETGSRKSMEDFWALRDVSFEVNRGEVVGIIGRNGAGKSTLLKVLSRITEPTEGRVRIRGRVASLLEVGTGFHPELTGRENIFLNGAILGMHRSEIKQKFDEIVAFAEVDKFLDTPVKRYSSGMYVRLAFAVAAHLEPEILVVDEVLAVGDAEFQKKCLGKMREVSTGGRTVLFVSHNLAAIRNLCTTGMYFESGRLKQSGTIQDITQAYQTIAPEMKIFGMIKKNGLELTEFKLCREGFPAAIDSAVFGENYEFRFKVKGNIADLRLGPMLRIRDQTGTLVSSICGLEEGIDFFPMRGSVEWVAKLQNLQLFPGRYSVSLQLFGQEPQAYLEAEDALVFHVEAGLIPGASKPYRSDHGLVRVCAGMSVSEE